MSNAYNYSGKYQCFFLSPSCRSKKSSNNVSTTIDDQGEFVNGDDLQKVISIPQQRMKTFFQKLASNGQLKTMKEKRGKGKSHSLKEEDDKNKTQEMKLFDSNIDIEKYIMNDLLLTDYKDCHVGVTPCKKYKKEKEGKNVFKRDYHTNPHIHMKSNIKQGNKSIQFKSSKETANNTPSKIANQTINEKVKVSKWRSSLNNKRKSSNNTDQYVSELQTPQKQTNSFKTNSKNLKDSFVSSTSSNDMLDISVKRRKCLQSKTDFKRPIKFLNSTKEHKPVPSGFLNETGGSIIEEYDYNKILSDIKEIFGDNLEFFDENMLFSALDEATNKGLIKGLLMLSYFQEKKLNTLNETVEKLKKQHKEEISEKEKEIEEMSKDFHTISTHLKAALSEASKFSKKTSNSKLNSLG